MSLKLAAITPSRNRPSILRKHALPFLTSLGIEYRIGLEQTDSQQYDSVPNAVYSADNIGITGALLSMRASLSNTELLFKIDDDVRGFTGNLKKNLPVFIAQFEKHPKLGAICFPYEQEFYYPARKLFSYVNARLQTCYIIRQELLGSWLGNVYDPVVKPFGDPFEDFLHFIDMRSKGYFTLLASANRIKCLPVGKGVGGLQDFNRAEYGLKTIKEIIQMYPKLNLQIRHKSESSWQYEPDWSKEPLLQKQKLS